MATATISSDDTILAFVNGAKMYVKGLKSPDGARGPNLNRLWYIDAKSKNVDSDWDEEITGGDCNNQ